MAEEKPAEEPKSADGEVKEGEKEEPVDPVVALLTELRAQIKHIQKAVSLKEHRYITRVLRSLASTRKKVSDGLVLRKLILQTLPDAPSRDALIQYLPEPMDSGSDDATPEASADDASDTGLQQALPEIECYLHLLVLIVLLDSKQLDRVIECSNALVAKVDGQNRRSLDAIGAKCYFYYARAYELTDRLHEIRRPLLARLRTSTLQFDAEGQATVTNLLLRNLLHYKLYDQANKLVVKITFPSTAPNSESARFMYYCGVIKAVMLDYTEANNHLLQALQKSPQNTAVGFRQAVNKHSIVVQLLLGHIPDRALFRQKVLRLEPYFELTQAVREGDVQVFTAVVAKYHDRFLKDNIHNLITRLRQNVIKAGIRKICLSYSRISLADVAVRLRLDSAEDAEFIVAKAIHDGVIEASINHAEGYMQSRDTLDQYSTTEPQAEFHKRISFCLNLHNHSVKAMRYPEKKNKEETSTTSPSSSSK